MGKMICFEYGLLKHMFLVHNSMPTGVIPHIWPVIYGDQWP